VSEVLPLVAVVDDEVPVLKALERLLRSARFKVATFETGAAFLESLKTRLPDCVVLDLHMPGMSALDVLAQLNADQPGKVAVIVMTAHDTPNSQQRALESGASAYLRKPVDAPSLLGAIRAAIADYAERTHTAGGK
jgi:FixJ family two-component response regulator